MENKIQTADTWNKSCVKIGTIFTPIIMLAMFIPIVYVSVRYGSFPDWGVALKAWFSIASVFIVFYIMEPISYYSVLGLGGTYLGVTTGNICDIRMSASATAQSVAGVKIGTKEGDITSTIGIAASVVVTLITVLVAAIAGTAIVDLLPDRIVIVLQNYCIQAIMGAIYVQFCKFEPKLKFLILVTTLIAFVTLKISTFTILIALIVCVIISRILFKRGFFDEKGKKGEE